MSTKVHIVTIDDDLALPHVIGIVDQLKKSIDRYKSTVLQLAGVEDIDLAGIQLLHSSRRYAEGKNREFHLVGDVSSLVAERLVKSGFISESTNDGKGLERLLFDGPQSDGSSTATVGTNPGDTTDA